MPDRDPEFRPRDHLCIVEWATEGGVYAAVQVNELLYTKDQVCRAREAYEFIRNCGYPSSAEAQHLLRDGYV
jgi:hypothetical protein